MIDCAALPTILKNMLTSGRAVHSLGIEGASRGEMLSIAYMYSAGLMCDKALPCGRCDSCKKILKGMHRDVRLLDTASGGFAKANIRQMRADAYIAPIEGSSKLYIVDCTDGIPAESQSLLLKIIEEPPDDTYFVFLTNGRKSLLPTIVSRLVWISAKDMSTDECIRQLSLTNLDTALVKRAVTLAGSDMELAKRLLADTAMLEQYEDCVKVIRSVASADVYNAIKLLIPFEKDRKTYTVCIGIMLKMLGCNSLMTELGVQGQTLLDINTALLEALRMLDVSVQLRSITILLANTGV